MKHLMLVFMSVSAMAHGQISAPDSLTVQELGEITITADVQHTGPTKTVYMPSKENKSTASDGVSLLSRMQIPQLSVNPLAETVRTADNQAVSIFINYRQATPEDVSGLNPEDIRKVEYLDFPADPRFMRAQHAVNFITVTKVYGGYTKLSGNEHFGVRSGEAKVYSKFSCRNMEYDLMLSGDYDYNQHIGSITDETYRLDTGTVKRLSTTDSGKHRQRGLYTALRASWSRGEKFSWRNLLSFHRINTPTGNCSGTVSFTSLFPDESYFSVANSCNNSGGWQSELYAVLGRGWTINATLLSELRHNTSDSAYTAGSSSIINDADEDSWWLRGDAQVNKALSERISIFSSISSAGGRTKINYSGSSDSVNRFRQTFTGLYAGLSMTLPKVSGSVDAGYAFESNYINGKTMGDRYPFTHVNVQYAQNSRNSVNVWFQYATMSPDATMKNPNTIRRSELMYISGNPDLKCSRHLSANVSYLWMPDNKWQLTAYVSAFRIINRQIAVYTPEGPEGMMLKKYQNDGDYNHGQVGMNLTAKFIDGKLTCSLAPHLLLYKTTGTNRVEHYPLTVSASINYYLRTFFLNAYWESGSSYVDGETAYLRRMPMSYSLSAGWASKGWNLQLSLVNLLRSSWIVSDDTLKTPWFDSAVRQYGSDYHRRISLSITYTFNYGKKVKSTDEIGHNGSIDSSILK